MPRYNMQLQDVVSLMEYAKELGREKQRLELIVEAMKSDGVDSLEVRNNTIGVRGLSYIAKFCDACREAHLGWRQGQGAYSAEPKAKRKRKR